MRRSARNRREGLIPKENGACEGGIGQHSGNLMRAFGLSSLSALSLALGLSACTPVKTEVPKAEASKLGRMYVAAFDHETTEPLDDAPYLDAIDAAVHDPSSPESLAIVVASLDALVFHVNAPSRVGMPIAFRSREAMSRTVLRLRQAWEALEDPGSVLASKTTTAPFLRAHLAHALHQLSLFSGEARGARVWAERRGCASEAAIVGPVDWTPLSSLEQVSPIPMVGRFEREFPGVSQFDKLLGHGVVPTIALADTCQIGTRVTGTSSGTFDVVVDIDNPRDQVLSFVVTSTSAASLRVGGATVLARPFDAGGQPLTVMGQARAEQGVLRAILRLGDRGDAGPIELDVIGDDGLPLRTKAPRAGDMAKAKATAPKTIAVHGGTGPEAHVLEAAALMGLGDPRRAEHAIETAMQQNPNESSVALALLYARAMEAADDVPEARRIERTRAAADAALKKNPKAWEAKLLQAELTERRKGSDDGIFYALKDLGVQNPTSDLAAITVPELARIQDLADQAGLRDVSERVFAELEARVPGSATLAQADASLHRRTGRDAIAPACNGALGKDGTGCAAALLAVGDRKGALAEIARLRELRSAPNALLDLELSIAIQEGDRARALAIYDAIPVGQRSLLTVLPLLSAPADRPLAKALILRDETKARDGIMVLPKLAAIFDEPSIDAKRYEEDGRALVLADRKSPSMQGAATAVLRHVEHYGLDESGLMQVFLYDLRRVSGTTDVEQGAYVAGPMVEGRGNEWVLRRRIYKKDGRVLEPDTQDRGPQGSGDMNQLEQGDYLEIIRSGFYLPTDSGQMTLDTPDLLPDRTSVREAELVIRIPEHLELAQWSHALLGKPEIVSKQGYKYLTYRLKNAPARRMEDGVSPLEQGVRVSLGTQTWPNIARSIGETIRSLQDSDPFMTRFADEARKAPEGGPAQPSTESNDAATVAHVVDHVGHALKIAQSGGLSDMASAYGGGPQGPTARSMIEDKQGSRSWVIYRTLKQLGLKVDLAIAETEPFSTTPGFPAHTGRFRYPLVVAHLKEGDQWIDADVDGPPLPPGRVSPELRGRTAILSTGQMIPVSPSNDPTFDDVDIKLVVDEKGVAKGKVVITLRGRQAQSLSEAFNTVVGSDRREMLRSVVLGWLPLADVDDVRLASGEGSWEVSIEADVSIHGFGSPEGRDGHSFVLPGFEPVHGAGRAGTLAQSYATRGARQSALSIDSPIQYKVRRRIELAKGLSLVKGPTNVDVKDPNVVATRTAKVEGSVITEDYSLSLPTGIVAADHYRTFVDDVQAIDAGFLTGIRVKVK